MLAVRLLASFAAAGILAAQTPGIGTGAPTQALQDLFLRSWYRNRFYLIVYPVPKTEVRKIGTSGLIQLFEDPSRLPDLRYVLIKADANQPWYVDPATGISTGDVYQVYPPVWTYLTSLNNTTPASPAQLNTTGFPLMDNDQCPSLDDGNLCSYIVTDKDYALFVYDHVLNVIVGSTFSVRDPFFTRWKSLGALTGLGSAVSGEQALTSPITQSTATVQTFRKGQLFNVTSGLSSGRLLTVAQPIYDFYAANGGPSQYLGFPTSDELLVPDGRRRQSFEGGAVEYTPGGQVTVQLPVSSVTIAGVSNPLRLKVGETAKVRVVLLAANNTELTGRAVSWLTTNGRVVAVEPFTGGATIRALGGGTASVTAVSEGKSSEPVTVSVSAPCCQPGDGAPTLAISQAFDDIVTRNRLFLHFPGPSPVRRVGSGYIQEFTSDGTPSQEFVLAVADSKVAGYYLTGIILERYQALGGPLGSLGYPASDPTSTGRQLFEKKAALAGSPVRLVTNAILDRWALWGYEAGVLGPPLSEAVAFTTFTATAGMSQDFGGGMILSASAGPLAGRTFAVTGGFRDKYAGLGGPAGPFGMPSSEQVVIDARTRQEFEGGALEQLAGSSDVTATEKPRSPSVSATPSPALAGGKVRVAVGGFPPGSALRIRVAGQAPFEVTPDNGSYAWSIVIPPTARSETVLVQAATTDGKVSAEGSYAVRSLTEGQIRLTKVSGDNQSGLPGAAVLQPLRISLRDSAGNPAPGISVVFQASPGASVLTASATTDPQGEAQALLRLPAAEGVALVTAAVPGRVVTFSARSVAASLENFPKLSQNLQVPLGAGPATIAQKGALLASTASILRFLQDRGDLPAVPTPVDVLGLNRYLTALCTPDSQGLDICDGFLRPQGTSEQVVNLWRIPGFATGQVRVAVDPATMDSIRDSLGRGAPALVALKLMRDGQPAGSHFVVATGITANGAIGIHDPGTLFGKTYLNDFLGTFTAGGHQWSGTLTSVIRFEQASPDSGGFLVAGNAPATIDGRASSCRASLEWLDSAVGNLDTPTDTGTFSQTYCEGTESEYQVNIASSDPHLLNFTDLGNPANLVTLRGQGAAAYRAQRASVWDVIPQELDLAMDAFLNPASLTSQIAPGGLISVFGSGLSGGATPTSLLIGGQNAPIVALGTFRLTALVPDVLLPDVQQVTLQSQFGTVTSNLSLLPVAPAIFQREGNLGVVFSASGTPVSLDNPAIRGQRVRIYATGLGSVSGQSLLVPALAAIGGRQGPANYVGMATGLPGVYMLDVLLPSDLAPSDRVIVRLVQGGMASNSVEIPVQ